MITTIFFFPGKKSMNILGRAVRRESNIGEISHGRYNLKRIIIIEKKSTHGSRSLQQQ